MTSRRPWASAGPIPGDPDWSGGTVFTDRRTIAIDAAPGAVFRAVCRIGGGHGWYAADWLWRVRGALDRLVGGPGLRRGRRDPEAVSFGEALDFSRVTGLERNCRLSLRAEMKLPGEALLDFVSSHAAGPAGPRSRLTQTARFLPRGLWGLAYWYAVLPFHGVVFRGMLAGSREPREPLPRMRGSRTRPGRHPIGSPPPPILAAPIAQTLARPGARGVHPGALR